MQTEVFVPIPNDVQAKDVKVDIRPGRKPLCPGWPGFFLSGVGGVRLRSFAQ